MLLGCTVVSVYAGRNDFSLMRPPSVELEVRGFFDDEEDSLVFRATERVFHRVADHVVLGEYDDVQQQGNALGLLLQMVVNNWTYRPLNEVAEAAFTRIFEEGNPREGALGQLIDSIEEEYTNGASTADMVMRWILASVCRWGTPIPYIGVRLRAHQLLLNTHLVPRHFVYVFEAPDEENVEEMNYQILLANLLETMKAHFSALEDGDHATAEAQLGALDAIFDLATGAPDVRDDMALIETVTTGYDRLFQRVVLPEEVLLNFIEGLAGIENPGEASRNLIHCILVLLCEQHTYNPYLSVRQRAYAILQDMNAVPPAFVTADLGAGSGTAD